MLQKQRPPSQTAAVDDTTQLAGIRRSGAYGEAVALLDRGLVNTANRQIVSSDEVSDLLLDLRVVLLASQMDALGYATAAGPGTNP